MTALRIKNFGGLVPRLSRRDLPDGAGQIAENLLADTPEFRPLTQDMDGIALTGAPVDEPVRTLYRYPTGSTTIVATPLSLSLVRSTIARDQYDRVYASTMSDEPEQLPPHVLQSGVPAGSPWLRPLGVPYPTAPLQLFHASGSDPLVKPVESMAMGQTIVQQIRAIAYGTVEEHHWNPLFDLTSRAGFRPDQDRGAQGWWQRIFTATTSGSSFTWNTYNGLPVERFLWTLEASNVPFVESPPGTKTFYLPFPATLGLLRVKPDTAAAEAQLRALVVPGTATRVLSDEEITGLMGLLRAVYPADPLSHQHPELVSLGARFGVAYRELVELLDKGFDTSVPPQAAYHQVAAAWEEAVITSDAVAAFFQRLRDHDFEAALTAYFDASRVVAKIPEGELEEVEMRYYTYTWVNEWGEESKPYLPGDGNTDKDLPLLACNQAQQARIVRPPAPPGTTGEWKWRLYRSAMGADAAGFFFVAEIAVGTTEFVDVRPTPALFEQLRSTYWFPPPSHDGRQLKGLVQMPGQFLAGFIDNTVYFSEPGHPYAWPPQYAMVLEGDVIGLAVFGSTLVALTHARPAYISGSSPESMTRDDIESVEAAASARSIAPVTGGVVFASQNGLCLASQGGIQNITRNLYTQEEWRALEPSRMLCGEYDGVLYFTRPALGDMAALHAASGKLVTLDMAPTALFTDPLRGVLVAALPPEPGQPAQGAILHYGSGPKRARWRSKRITTPAETGLAWLAVEGEQSPARPLTFDLYGYHINPVTGAEVEVHLMTAKASGGHSAVVADTRPLRVASGRFKDFEIEVRGECRITALILASSTQELQGVE